VRLVSAHYYLPWLEAASLVLMLLGIAVLCGGRPLLRWAAPSIAFLLFMIPLPYRVETAMSHPLQRASTLASTFLLQMIGLPALAEGNVIVLNDVRIGVEVACSGLTMMMSFFALSSALALIIKRPVVDRIVILLSAAPIALAANVIRITITGILHETAGSELADKVFHDWAGWLMMPIALGLLLLVLKTLSCLFVPAVPKEACAAELLGIAASHLT
jgi:exosortase